MGKPSPEKRPGSVSRREVPFRAGPEIGLALSRAPHFQGSPIGLSYAPQLRSWRGRLLPNGSRGVEVHAASFLRERNMVLDSLLQSDPDELSRILCHELGHFAWVRLSNEMRKSWRQLLISEQRHGVPGELGWSAQLLKERLPRYPWKTTVSMWRNYSCESFCDTAAWVWGTSRKHQEFTLPGAYRQLRRKWFFQFQDRHKSVIPV